MSAGEVLGVLVSALFELLWWAILGVVSLVTALLRWRRPARVPRPVFWRPKPRAAQTRPGP
jgi:hypothetical protein